MIVQPHVVCNEDGFTVTEHGCEAPEMAMATETPRGGGGGNFFCSFADMAAFMSSVLIGILFSGIIVDSAYVLSKRCTRISLRDRRITVIEGVPFDFTLSAYYQDCDGNGCRVFQGEDFVCGKHPGCKSCTVYRGPFSADRIQLGIWFLADVSSRVPGATCTIGAGPDAADQYFASCVIKNNQASDMEQYLLRVVVLDQSKPNDLGSQVDLLEMVQYGAIIKLVAGEVDPLSSSMFWADRSRVYQPGDLLVLTVALRDAYGNIVSAKTGRSDLDYPWNVTLLDRKTNFSSSPNFNVSIDRNGYNNISFVAEQLGFQSVYVSNNGRYVGGYPLTFNVLPGTLYLPLCRGNWVDNQNTFVAGTIAKFRLKLVDKTNSPLLAADFFYFGFKIFDEAGNKDLLPDVQVHSEGDSGYSICEFKTAKAGRFYLFIGNETFFVPGSPFPYDVIVGSIYIPSCKGALMGTSFKAGSAVALNVTLLDSCGNLVTRLNYIDFVVGIKLYDKEVSHPKIVKGLEQLTGYQTIIFYPTISGKYTMSVGNKKHYISNSPFNFEVLPGPFSVALSTVIRQSDFMNAIAGSPIKLKVQQNDVYGNTYTTEIMYEFRILAFEILDGKKVQVVPRVSTKYDASAGVQSLNIVLLKAGNYILEICSKSGNISGSPFSIIVKAGPLNVLACIGSWVSATISAGSLAQFRVVQMDSYGNNVSSATGSSQIMWLSAKIASTQMKDAKIASIETMSFATCQSLSFKYTKEDISDKAMEGSTLGTNSTGVKVVPRIDVGIIDITFNLTTVGDYYLYLEGQASERMHPLSGSPYLFTVVAGAILPAACEFAWLHNDSLVAGDQALASLSLKDSFNNAVLATQKELKAIQVRVYRKLKFEIMDLYDVKMMKLFQDDKFIVSFYPKLSGTFQLIITDAYGLPIQGSPFQFMVLSGPVVIKNCSGKWENSTQNVEEGELARFIIMERDKFGNPVCRNLSEGERQLEFQAKVVRTDRFDEVRVLDLEFTPMPGEGDGIVCGQLLTFFVFNNLGHFNLEVKSSNQSIYGSPYPFNVVEGPVSNSLSTFEGPGLQVSKAGRSTYYIMKLRDEKGNPKGSHVSSLNVQIFKFGGTVQIKPNISILQYITGTFNISYFPEISGSYVIMTRWIGIPLGDPRYMTVNPGSISVKNCSGNWDQGIISIQTGQIARFLIIQRDVYGNDVPSNNKSDAVSFTAQVFKVGESQPISTPILTFQLWGDIPTTTQLLSFQIWEEGSFQLQIQSKGQQISGSPYPFTCTQGQITIPECSGEWRDGKHSFSVGDTAKFLITCAQDVSTTNLSFNPSKFEGIVYTYDKSIVLTPDLRVEKMTTETLGSQLMAFSLNRSGDFLLSVQNAVKSLTASPFKFTYDQGPISIRHCTGEWEKGINEFPVGSLAAFIIRQSDIYGNAVYEAVYFTAHIYLADVHLLVPVSNLVIRPLFTNRTEYKLITFSMNQVGNFRLYVSKSSYDIAGSPFPFSYIAGNVSVNNTVINGEGLSPLASVNFWNEILVLMKDSHNNTVDIGNTSWLTMTAFGSDIIDLQNFVPSAVGGGYRAAYKPSLAGPCDLHIYYKKEALPGSPFRVNVGAGWVQARYCTAVIEPSTISAGYKVKVYVTARDLQGDSVSYSTQAVSFIVNPLPLGIAYPESLSAKVYDAELGSYFANFSITISGIYSVEICAYGSLINNTLYTLNILPGAIHPPFCLLSTTDVKDVRAGSSITVFVMAKDIYNNTVEVPSFGRLTPFSANFTGPRNQLSNLSYIGNGTFSSNISCQAIGIYTLMVTYNHTFLIGSSMLVNVTTGLINASKCSYTMNIGEKVLIGTYGILTIQARDSFGNNCTSGGNGFLVTLKDTKTFEAYSGIPFDNDSGRYTFPFQLENAGTYSLNVSHKGIRVSGQEHIVVLKGTTEVVLINSIAPTILPTQTYTTVTMVGENLLQVFSFSCKYRDIEKIVGRFNTTDETLECSTPYIKEARAVRLEVQLLLYQGKSTFNFDLTFYVDTLPTATHDDVWSWENKFVSFNPLSNDRVAYGLPVLTGICQAPRNGSTEMIGSSLRYTPNANFTGNDMLVYIIRDFKNRLAKGYVTIFVYTLAPRFVSLPIVIVGMEDQSIPTKGSIQGVQIASPNIADTLTVEVQAQSGLVVFVEELAYLWQGVQIISYDTNNKDNTTKASLKFTGPYTLISTAVQAFRYRGKPYFNGNDIITLHVWNMKFEGAVSTILVSVQAKNNPPVINASSQFFNASYLKAHKEIPIAGLSVGDPDQHDIQGNNKKYTMQILLEVNLRSLQITLNSSALATIISQQEGSNVWATPSDTDISPGKVLAYGAKIQFEDTVEACNNALKSLKLLRGNTKGLKTIVLTMLVSDLGNFGCYGDCTKNTSTALQATIQISLDFEFVRPDIRAKVASSLTCTLVFIIYITLLIIRYRKRLRYRLDEEEFIEEDEIKKTRVFNPLWSKDEEREPSFDFGVSPITIHNKELQAHAFEPPTMDESSFDDINEMIPMKRSKDTNLRKVHPHNNDDLNDFYQKNIFMMDDY